ncbi:MAG: substrate-binding domain-containing protein [Kiloniellaceae bacterium]
MPQFSTFRRGVPLAVLLLLAMATAPLPGRAADSVLRIGGTGAALSLMAHLGGVFRREHPDVAVEVLPSLGSGGGIRALAEGVLDLAVSARPLKAQEAAEGLQALPLWRTPFVIVSSLRNPTPIAADRLAGLFGDPAARWPDGTPVHIILRPTSESDSALLARSFAGMEEALARARLRPEVPVAQTDQENLRLAGEIGGSLTAATLVQVISEYAAVTVLPIDGIAPTLDNLESGRYPHAKEMILVRRAGDHPALDRFVAFLASPAGSRIIRESGAVPLL